MTNAFNNYTLCQLSIIKIQHFTVNSIPSVVCPQLSVKFRLSIRIHSLERLYRNARAFESCDHLAFQLVIIDLWNSALNLYSSTFYIWRYNAPWSTYICSLKPGLSTFQIGFVPSRYSISDSLKLKPSIWLAFLIFEFDDGTK